jgi:hypothetical protein
VIPKTGWKPISDAPKNGEILVSKQKGPKGNDEIFFIQWLPSDDMREWAWRAPWTTGRVSYEVSVWMTFDELRAAQALQPKEEEFDL